MTPSQDYAFTIDIRWPVLEQDSRLLPPADIIIIRDDDDDRPPYFTFSSPHLDELTVPEEIWARGLALSRLYVGAYNLINNADEGGSSWIGSGRLHNLYVREGRRYSEVNVSKPDDILPANPFSRAISDQPLPRHVHPESNVISQLIYLARTNDDLLSILIQLGSPLTWQNLYKVLDTIKYRSRQKSKKYYKNQLLTAAGVSESEVGAFTGVANNYELLGELGRHGENGEGTPKNQMNLYDSIRLIIKLCKAYINLTHNIDTGPLSKENPITRDSLFQPKSL